MKKRHPGSHVPFKLPKLSLLSSLAAVSASLLGVPAAQAANGTWTSLTSGLWSNSANWSGSTIADGSGFTADFSTLDVTADVTVSLDSARTIGNLTFGDTTVGTAAGWTVDNNGSGANILTLAGTSTPTITVNALGTAKVATISAELAGNQGLSKAGAGQLTVTGANSYSGTTTVNAGTMAVSGTSGSILNSSGISVATGSNFNIVNTSTANSGNRVSDTAAITLTGSNAGFAFTNDAIANTSYTETVGQLNISSGNARITTTAANATGGVSTLTLASLNRTAGSTVTFATTASLGTTRNQILFTSNPTPDAGGLIGGWATAGSADFASYDATNGVGVVTNVGNTSETTWASTQNVKITASQTLTADRVIGSLVNNTPGAGIALNLGGFTLRVESGGILNAQSANGNTTISNGNLTAGYSLNTNAELFLLGSQGSTRPSTVSANIVNNGTGVVSLVVNGSVNNSGGTVILSGNNTYTGTTTIAGGSAQMGSSTAINNSKTLTIAAGAVLLGSSTSASTANNVTVDGLFGGGTYNGGASNGGILSVGNSNGDGLFTGTLTPNGGTTRDFAFVKNGTGTQIMAGTDGRDVTTSATTSTTTINGGTLQFAKQVSLYNNNTAKWTTSKIIVNNGGTLALNVGGTGEFTSANVDTIKALGTATGGFLSGSKLGLDTTNAAGGNFVYNSIIADTNAGANSIGLTKLGTGTLTLGGANTYTGVTTVKAGILALGADNVIADVSNLVLAGGTLATGGFSETVGTLTINTASVIDFGAGVSNLVFSDSSALAWTGTVTLANYDIGTDTLRFGTSGSALTSSQLNSILLSGFTAGLDNNGFVTFTAVPEPGDWGIILGVGCAFMIVMRARNRRNHA